MQYRIGDTHEESGAAFVSIDSEGLLFRLPDGSYCREADFVQSEDAEDAIEDEKENDE